MTATTDTLPAGQLVRYTGSVAARRGPYRVQWAAVAGGQVRYDLTYTWNNIYQGADAIALDNVRPESIRPVSEKTRR